jgi:hypothetical protein
MVAAAVTGALPSITSGSTRTLIAANGERGDTPNKPVQARSAHAHAEEQIVGRCDGSNDDACAGALLAGVSYSPSRICRPGFPPLPVSPGTARVTALVQ